MLDVSKYGRYESPELIGWKKLTEQEQFDTVNELSQVYYEKVKVSKVKDQSIEVDLFMSKNEVYEFLVEYEAYLRENLGNLPIIVLLKDRADENRKRK